MPCLMLWRAWRVSFVESTSRISDHSAAKKFQEKETYWQRLFDHMPHHSSCKFFSHRRLILYLQYVFPRLCLQNSSFSGPASDPGKQSFCKQPTSAKKWPQVGPAIFSKSASLLLPPIARLVKTRVQSLAADIPTFSLSPGLNLFHFVAPIDKMHKPENIRSLYLSCYILIVMCIFNYQLLIY